MSHNHTRRHLLSGGPVNGPVQTEAASKDGRVWTIVITHVNCACEWCARVPGSVVDHMYEQDDSDLFIYRESRTGNK